MANVAAIRIEQRAGWPKWKAAERVMQRESVRKPPRNPDRHCCLPARPDIAGVDLAGFNVPCRTVGGDYYDFFPYAGPSVGLALGDGIGQGHGGRR